MLIETEVQLLDRHRKKRESRFENLAIGEGVVSRTGTRVKTRNDFYLHFTLQGQADEVQGKYWPEESCGKEIKNFVLVAKEVE